MIIISSDSTCDLGVLFKERNVPTLPLAVVLGGESFEDGVTVTPDKIYEFVDKTAFFLRPPREAWKSIASFLPD